MKIKEFLPEEWGLLYAAFAFSQGIGLLSYWALPLVAGSLITGLGLSTTEVGMIGTIEGSGLFISSLLLANFVDRGYRKRVAITSVAVVVIANLVCGIVNMGFMYVIEVFRTKDGLC